MYDFWREWFALPLDEKMKRSKKVTGKSGYMPFGSEAPGFGPESDPKEYFHWKLSHRAEGFGSEETAAVFSQCFDTAQQWMIDRGLVEVSNAVSPRDCVLRVIHYPPHPSGAVGQAHRDFDLLTVSVEGTAPGLEVLNPKRIHNRSMIHPSDWEPQETGIQVGEMLEEYTRNDLRCDVMHIACGHPWKCRHQDQSACTCHRANPLQATTHRVRTAPNTERYKAVFFYLPPMDFVLRPGFTAGDYLKDVMSKAGTYGIGAK
jgi:isopenicillin N synthase-like dioxygenase